MGGGTGGTKSSLGYDLGRMLAKSVPIALLGAIGGALKRRLAKAAGQFQRKEAMLYSRSQKNGDIFVPFCPVQTASVPFMLVVPFPFHMHACTISNWVWSFDVQKMKGQLVHLLTRINSLILPRSSSLLPLFNSERVL
jgi:hypothetical protein